MEKVELTNITIITAAEGKYLVPKKLPKNIKEEDMGKPVRILFNNTGIIPEFEEREV